MPALDYGVLVCFLIPALFVFYLALLEQERIKDKEKVQKDAHDAVQALNASEAEAKYKVRDLVEIVPHPQNLSRHVGAQGLVSRYLGGCYGHRHAYSVRIPGAGDADGVRGATIGFREDQLALIARESDFGPPVDVNVIGPQLGAPLHIPNRQEMQDQLLLSDPGPNRVERMSAAEASRLHEQRLSEVGRAEFDNLMLNRPRARPDLVIMDDPVPTEEARGLISGAGATTVDTLTRQAASLAPGQREAFLETVESIHGNRGGASPVMDELRRRVEALPDLRPDHDPTNWLADRLAEGWDNQQAQHEGQSIDPAENILGASHVHDDFTNYVPPEPEPEPSVEDKPKRRFRR